MYILLPDKKSLEACINARGTQKSHLKLKADEQKSLDTDINSSAPETLRKMRIHKPNVFSNHGAVRKRGESPPLMVLLCFCSSVRNLPHL